MSVSENEVYRIPAKKGPKLAVAIAQNDDQMPYLQTNTHG